MLQLGLFCVPCPISARQLQNLCLSTQLLLLHLDTKRPNPPEGPKVKRGEAVSGQNTRADFAPALEQTGSVRSSRDHRSTTTESCPTTRAVTRADQRALCNLSFGWTGAQDRLAP